MDLDPSDAGGHVRPLRIVVTGSESTGKTTLAGQLARHLGAVLVPEYSRRYAESVGRLLTVADHPMIARGQIATEDEQLGATGDIRLAVQDTDLLSTVVYASHYYGQCEDWVVQAASDRRPDLYLLLEIDVPWVADSIRDRGEARAEVQQLFRDAVATSGVPHVRIIGTWEERLDRAISAAEALVASRS